jgi:hypothetical protein
MGSAESVLIGDELDIRLQSGTIIPAALILGSPGVGQRLKVQTAPREVQTWSRGGEQYGRCTAGLVPNAKWLGPLTIHSTKRKHRAAPRRASAAEQLVRRGLGAIWFRAASMFLDVTHARRVCPRGKPSFTCRRQSLVDVTGSRDTFCQPDGSMTQWEDRNVEGSAGGVAPAICTEPRA